MDIFDVIGPAMIGPSSSHTAGAARIGRVARKILGAQAAEARVGLAGSFALTCRGHGTDKAIIAGVLGMKPDDERIPRSLEIAEAAGLRYSFEELDIPRAHPNTAIVELFGSGGERCRIEGASIGGGRIRITGLNGMRAAFDGEADTLIVAHNDRPGVVAAVAGLLAGFGANIGGFRLSRPRKSQTAIMTIELDSGIEKRVVAELRGLEDVASVVYMQAAGGPGI